MQYYLSYYLINYIYQDIRSNQSHFSDTTFIDVNPELFHFSKSEDRGTKLLSYLAEIMVNGPVVDLPVDQKPATVTPTLEGFKKSEKPQFAPPGWRDILKSRGPEGYAKAVRRRLKIVYQFKFLITLIN